MKRIPIAVMVKGTTLCVVLVLSGLLWREILLTGKIPWTPPGVPAQLLPTLHHPFIEFLKLVAAFLVGLTITVMHRLTGHDPSFGRSMEHAQVLLCISGALMMIIIGDSLARAFGIAGAAAIIRFRTPVEDPKDIIILFLSLGLGMACGLGAFGIAGLGTAFLSCVLIYLSSATAEAPRKMILSLTSAQPEFPAEHVKQVLSRYGIAFETQEISQGPVAGAKYRITVSSDLALEDVSEALQAQGEAGIQTVSWEIAKKKRT